jgi:hypothetical protein
MHSSLMVSAQNWMRRPDDGIARRQTPPLNMGKPVPVEEAVDVVTPLPLGVGRGCFTRGVTKQLPGCHERPIRCWHRLGH